MTTAQRMVGLPLCTTVFIVVGMLFVHAPRATAQRQMEKLGRGVVA